MVFCLSVVCLVRHWSFQNWDLFLCLVKHKNNVETEAPSSSLISLAPECKTYESYVHYVIVCRWHAIRYIPACKYFTQNFKIVRNEVVNTCKLGIGLASVNEPSLQTQKHAIRFSICRTDSRGENYVINLARGKLLLNELANFIRSGELVRTCRK